MAHIISLAEPSKVPNSEKITLEALQNLGDEWTVLHSIAWQCPRNGRQGDGEVDILLLHPNCGAIILEIKGGGIDVINGSWFTSNAKGNFKIKDPFKQATDSKHALLAYFREVLNWFPLRARICHGVVFPDIHVSQRFEAAGPLQIVLDAQGLRNIEHSVTRIVDYWKNTSKLTSKDIAAVVAKLAPSATIRSPLAVRAHRVSDELLRLTQEQFGVLDGLARNRRAVVMGGAGTGKTLLAIEKAKRLADSDFQVLLICYNELLGKHIESLLSPISKIKVARFHSLVMELARKAKLPIPAQLEDTWWSDSAPLLLLDASKACGFAPDAIIIDEAQDFEWDWIEALLSISRDPAQAICFAFADPLQDLYRRPWASPHDWAQFELTKNCRNSLPIAQKVARSVGIPAPIAGADGPAPVYQATNFQSTGFRSVQDCVLKLIDDEGFHASEIVVLTDSPFSAKDIQMLSAGATPFCGPNEHGIRVETIQRFKGLESEVIIVVCPKAFPPESVRARAYVALSRARSILYVFAPRTAMGSLGFGDAK